MRQQRFLPSRSVGLVGASAIVLPRLPLAPEISLIQADGATLQTALPRFLQQVVGSAPGERYDRQRRVFVRIRHEASPIGDKQVFDVVGLAKPIEGRGLAIRSHPYCSYFMDDGATESDP